jgi:hypothetical protein
MSWRVLENVLKDDPKLRVSMNEKQPSNCCIISLIYRDIYFEAIMQMKLQWLCWE